MQIRRLLPWLGSLALFVATFFVYPVRYDPRLNGTGYESIALAKSIHDHHAFADPFYAMPTGPSAQLAPAFPVFVALVMGLVPDPPKITYVLGWVAVALVAFQLALLPWIARRMNLGYATGFVAAVLWLVCRIPVFERWETQFVALFCLLLAVEMYSVSTRPASTGHIVALGLFWGFVLLWNPAGVLVLAAWLVYLHFATALPARKKVILALLPVLMVSPWVIRNRVILHHFFLIRDNLGLELQLANNPCASYAFDFNRATGCYSLFHPNLNGREAANVRRLGEFNYNEAKLHEATRWIRQNKRAFVGLTAERAAAFWVPSSVAFAWELDDGVPVERHIITLLTALSAIGMLLLRKRNRTLFAVILLWLAFFPAVHYVTQYNERFRVPILWATFLPACYFLVHVAGYLRQRMALATEDLRVPARPH